MKKYLAIIGLCLLCAYLIFSAFFFKDKPKEDLCTHFELVIKNKDKEMSFVDTSVVTKYVRNKGLNPVGKLIKDVNTSLIEEAILGNNLIEDAQAYVTNNGSVRVNIVQRTPVLRVMPQVGTSYYVDSKGVKMVITDNFTAHLPIATGLIDEKFATTSLYRFAQFLEDEPFWNAQIEQIVVGRGNEITLIPRVGDHEIILGNLADYETKLEKLMLFYKKGLNKAGWNRYSVINLKFDKQVVCTKR